MEELQIGLLGPVEARRNGAPLALGGRNERIVLAALTLALNRAVSVDTLLAAVWNEHPPASAVNTLQSIVSRLRNQLGHDVIELTDHSYRVVVDPEQVDVVRFERMLADATALLVDDPPTAAAVASDALALWRGVPFGDLSDVEFLEPEVWRLDSLRLSASEVRLEADVACGRLASAIAELQAEVLEYPYRERIWYLLVLALARDGRRVDALRECQRLREVLGEIGLVPPGDICELEAMIINEDPRVRSHLHR